MQRASTANARVPRLLSANAVSALLLSLVMTFDWSSAVQADTIDRIRSAGKVILGYREDARPFSFKGEGEKPAGFSVELCQKITEQIKTELAMPGLVVEWSPIKADDRIAAIQQGQIDLMCGADTDTLSRRKDVSFSIPIYPSGVGAVLSVDAPAGLHDVLEGVPSSSPIWRGSPARILEKSTFAVVGGTTTEKWLAERIQSFQISANVIPVESYAAGIASLRNGQADVFFGERAIIAEAAGDDITNRTLIPLNRQFTNEPVALSLALNSDNLRLIVDRTLSRLYPTREFQDLYNKWFGAADVTTLLFYQLSALPE